MRSSLNIPDSLLCDLNELRPAVCASRKILRLRRITPSEICIILHIIRKPNSIIVLLFIQNISRALKT